MKIRRILFRGLSSVLFFGFTAAVHVSAGVVTLSGPTVTDDNTLIDGGLADYNFGAFDFSGGPGRDSATRRDLLRFDLASLSGTTLTSASLQLTLRDSGPEGSWTGDATVNLYVIHPSNAGWVEGTGGGTGAAGQTGSSTWNDAAYNTVNWVNSSGTGDFPGLGTPVDAYEATPVGSYILNDSDPGGTVKTINFADVSFLQNWIDNPSQNAGFLLTSSDLEAANSGIYRYATSENTSGKPILSLTTAVVPEPSTALLFLVGAGLLAIFRTRTRRV